MILLLWIIAGLAFAFFVWYFVIPYVQFRIILWQMSRACRKIAKKKNEALRDEFNDLAARLDELGKAEKL